MECVRVQNMLKMSGWRGWLQPVSFGAVMLASSALNTIVVTYYIPFFTSVEVVHPTAFYAGQVAFMSVLPLVWFWFVLFRVFVFGWCSFGRSFAYVCGFFSSVTLRLVCSGVWCCACFVFVVFALFCGCCHRSLLVFSSLCISLSLSLSVCMYDCVPFSLSLSQAVERGE